MKNMIVIPEEEASAALTVPESVLEIKEASFVVTELTDSLLALQEI